MQQSATRHPIFQCQLGDIIAMAFDEAEKLTTDRNLCSEIASTVVVGILMYSGSGDRALTELH